VYQTYLYTQPKKNYIVWDHTNLQFYKNSRVQSVLWEYTFVTGSVKQCIVVQWLTYFKDEVSWSHVNTIRNTGQQTIHTQRMNFKKSSGLQYWKFRQ
jgi:hypothetical protein